MRNNIEYGICYVAGIGLFLAHLGLQTAEGIGLVVADGATAVTLGGCPPEYRHPMVRAHPTYHTTTTV